jgi:hypothetical protein
VLKGTQILPDICIEIGATNLGDDGVVDPPEFPPF